MKRFLEDFIYDINESRKEILISLSLVFFSAIMYALYGTIDKMFCLYTMFFFFAGEYYSKLKFNDNATKTYNYDNSRLAFFFAYLFCIFTYFARLDSKNFAIEEGAVFILATIFYVIIGALFILFVTLKSCYKAYQLCHNNGKYFKDICDKTNNIREMYLPLAILYFVLVSSFGLLAKPIDGFTICASVLLGFSILVLKFGAISNPKLRFYKENSFILHTIGLLLIIVSA